jgi:CheY-like chemotaxis protein
MRHTPTILIIEDHLGIVDALRLLLEQEGYHVEAWTHEGMVHPLAEPLPEVILLDLLLGGMNGQTLCQQFKREPATRHIPVILMSANKHIARIASEVGADAWLLKPFEPEAVFTLLDQCLGKEDASVQ